MRREGAAGKSGVAVPARPSDRGGPGSEREEPRPCTGDPLPGEGRTGSARPGGGGGGDGGGGPLQGGAGGGGGEGQSLRTTKTGMWPGTAGGVGRRRGRRPTGWVGRTSRGAALHALLQGGPSGLN